jgi:hypothetical protein
MAIVLSLLGGGTLLGKIVCLFLLLQVELGQLSKEIKRTNLSEVKVKLFSFKDITVASTNLAGSGGDASIEAASVKLVGKSRLKFTDLVAPVQFVSDGCRDFGGLSSFSSCLFL